jgi:hypothetical protein
MALTPPASNAMERQTVWATLTTKNDPIVQFPDLDTRQRNDHEEDDDDDDENTVAGDIVMQDTTYPEPAPVSMPLPVHERQAAPTTTTTTTTTSSTDQPVDDIKTPPPGSDRPPDMFLVLERAQRASSTPVHTSASPHIVSPPLISPPPPIVLGGGAGIEDGDTVPILSRAAIADFLRPPNRAAGEHACRRGVDCAALRIGTSECDIRSCVPRHERVPLRVLILPGASTPIATTLVPALAELPQLLVNSREQDMCVLCLLWSTAYYVSKAMASTAEPRDLLQRFQVIVDQPGEYHSADCYPSKLAERFTGTPYPIIKFNVNRFAWVRDAATGLPRIQDFYRTVFPSSPATASMADVSTTLALSHRHAQPGLPVAPAV